MQTITVGFGSSNYSGASGSWLAVEVNAPFDFLAASKAFEKASSVQVVPCGLLASNKCMFSARMCAGDGAVLLLQAQHNLRGIRRRQASIMIRLRSTGPMLLVKGAMVPSAQSCIGANFILFEGRGDILTVEEAKAVGIHPRPSYCAEYFYPDDIAACFVVDTLVPAQAEKPELITIKTASGEVKPIAVSAPPRRRMGAARRAV